MEREILRLEMKGMVAPSSRRPAVAFTWRASRPRSAEIFRMCFSQVMHYPLVLPTNRC
jgi:hypothetical protein